MAISRLLFSGHTLEAPITDDNGVDFTVDYRTYVQVKCCGARNASSALMVNLENSRASEHRHGPRGLREHVDVLLVYARDKAIWYVIPGGSVPHAAAMTLGQYDQWIDAWKDAFE